MGDPQEAQTSSRECSEWLRKHGWIQDPDGTWGLPRSTCRYVSTETAYHLGRIIDKMDNEDANHG